jgi:hypothetical protein
LLFWTPARRSGPFLARSTIPGREHISKAGLAFDNCEAFEISRVNR